MLIFSLMKKNWNTLKQNYCISIKRFMKSDCVMHEKNNKNEMIGGHVGCSNRQPDSLFKKTFKFYKKLSAKSDLSSVLELHQSLPLRGVSCVPFSPVHCPSTLELSRLGLRPLNQWKLTTIKNRDGLYVLTDVFDSSRHLEWIHRALKIYPELPSKTNISLNTSDTLEVCF